MKCEVDMLADKEVRKCAENLLKRKIGEVADADRQRKIQIKNINQHYQFELRKADVQFEEDFERLQSSLKCGSLEQERGHSLATNAEGGISIVSRINQPQVARVVPLATANLVRYSGRSDCTALQLENKLIRDDISDATRYFRSATMQYSRSVPEVISVSVVSDSRQVNIGEEIFSVGDMVKCLSNLSQEEFHGMISDMSDTKMCIICGNSARFSFLVSQIREGRVVVSCDLENLQNSKILERYREALLK